MTYSLLDKSGVIAYVGQHAASYGLDPAAVLSVANHEGLKTTPGSFWTLGGESNISFGPPSWYGNGAGGAIIKTQGISNAPAWAWTPAGLDYWLQQVAAVPGTVGATGVAAISAIVHNFERPREDLAAGEIKNAADDYAQMQIAVGTSGGIAPLPSKTDPTVIPTPITQQPAPKDNSQQTAPPIQTGTFVSAMQTLVGGWLGPGLSALHIMPDMSGLILLLASLFAILIGAIIWKGDTVKSAAPKAAELAVLA